MEYNTTHDINAQISNVKTSINDNIKDISNKDAIVIYTELIKVSNILLDHLMICQTERENNKT